MRGGTEGGKRNSTKLEVVMEMEVKNENGGCMEGNDRTVMKGKETEKRFR